MAAPTLIVPINNIEYLHKPLECSVIFDVDLRIEELEVEYVSLTENVIC
jgi:hypothetical protein